jgi:hypothetical protein
VYSAGLLGGIGLIAILDTNSADLPYAALMASVALSLLPFGRQFFLEQFVRIHPRNLPHYLSVWRRHSRWSLIGVVTTEATVNAHAYIVTLLSGSSAFAPIAASALIIRPITVVMNALTEFERPQMARQIVEGQIGSVQRTAGIFLCVLIAAWIVTAAAAALLITYKPELVLPSGYSQIYLSWGMMLWMAVALMRILRTPDSVLLQAGGMFRWLAHASIISSGVSICAVAALLFLSGPLWSIGGILLGEAICVAWVWRQAWRWRVTVRTTPDLTGNEAVL